MLEILSCLGSYCRVRDVSISHLWRPAFVPICCGHWSSVSDSNSPAAGEFKFSQLIKSGIKAGVSSGNSNCWPDCHKTPSATVNVKGREICHPYPVYPKWYCNPIAMWLTVKWLSNPQSPCVVWHRHSRPTNTLQTKTAGGKGSTDSNLRLPV